MSSAFQGAGNWLTGAGMPGVGGFVSNLPYDVSNFFGGAGGGFGATGGGAVPPPPSPNAYGTPPAAVVDPYGTGTAASATPPGEVLSGDPGAFRSLSAPPIPSPASVLNNPAAAPTNYSPLNPPAGAPPAGTQASSGGTTGTDPSLWQSAINYVKAHPLQALGFGADIGQGIQRWMLQRTLSDPNALMGGASKLFQGMSKALKRNVIGPVRAEAQETGQINAPGLYAQAVASAVGPYQYQMQMQALADYIDALRAAGQPYPWGGGYGVGGPFPTGSAGNTGP
jgi:hypothetical protein